MTVTNPVPLGREPAFACVAADAHLQEGLTRLELYALHAMQGWCANMSINANSDDPWAREHMTNMAHASFDYAEAMVAEAARRMDA